MIEIKNVTKQYGNNIAVDDISFEVKDNEIVGFLGPNGAGKSTTMNMITGYIDTTKGKIIVKRTAKFKSFKRAVKRDYKNEYFMQLEKEQHKHLYKVTRFYKITKRRKSVFNQAKEIDGIIKKLERK